MILRSTLLLILAFTVAIQATESDWQIITYMNDVRDLVESDNDIWAATGGGIYRYENGQGSIRKYNNLDGLASLDINCIALDRRQTLIAGSRDGIVHLLRDGSDDWQAYFELQGKNLVDILAVEDTLWVAANSGVAVYLNTEDGLEFRDFYNNFPINISSASRLAVFNGRIFYGTSAGILYANASFLKANLKIAAAWKHISTESGLSDNRILDLSADENYLLIGTYSGADRLDRDFLLTPAPGWSNGTVRNIIRRGERLIFTRDQDYFEYVNDNWAYGQLYDKTISGGLISWDGNLWLGLVHGGLQPAFSQFPLLIEGPASNHVGNLTKDRNGNLWMASGKFKVTYGEGFYKYDFHNWTNYKFTGAWGRKNQTDFMFEDQFGKIWIGTWGGGVTILKDDAFDFIHAFPEDGGMVISNAQGQQQISMPGLPGSRLDCLVGAQVSGSTTYTVIPGFAEDDQGNLWIANHLAREPEYLAVIMNNQESSIPDCSEWMYFGDNIGMSLTDGELSDITMERYGDYQRVWMGTFNRGVLVLDHKNTITNPNDDILYRVTMTSDNLFSNTILSLATDRDGVIWIGTSGGLNSYQADPSGGSMRFYRHVGEIGPIENKINDIFVDASNNKWFATDGGVSVLIGDKSPWDASAWVHYTTQNSGLPNSLVNSVYVDQNKGEAYLGTESGLAIFKGPFAEIRQDMSAVSGGPNPFIVEDGKVFTLRNLALNSSVKIFNVAGKLVRRLGSDTGNIQGSRAEWDGRDNQGNPVPSGVYIYLVYNEQGQTGTGKIALIKP